MPRTKRTNKKSNRKTTKRGAYNKRVKRSNMNARAPFVETKSKTTEDLVNQFGLVDHINFQNFNSPAVHINPEVFTAWKQGLGEQEIIGQSVYCKYLKRKISIRFPQPNLMSTISSKPMEAPYTPQNYELIWGFVPAPLGLTGQTTPTSPNCSMSYINGYINEKVLDYLNQREDRLRFIPKKASTLRISGRKKIKPDLSRMSTAPIREHSDNNGDYQTGSIPDVHTSISWKMMRKVHFEKSVDLHGGNEGLFPNYTWLPFCVFVAWDWSDIPADNRPESVCQLAFNDAIYYTDS